MTLHPFLLDPATPLRERPIALPGKLQLQSDGLLVGETRFGVPASEPAPLTTDKLPGEFYLRQLLDLDVSSDEELVTFMEQYGLLGTSAEPDRPLTSVYRPKTTLDSARTQAKRLRDTTRTLLANEQQIALDEFIDSWESSGSLRDSAVYQNNPLEAAVALAGSRLTNWLSPLGPFVAWNGSPDRRSLGVPLETGIAIQMYNHLAEGASYRRCANPNCKRVFVRQTGRAHKGQHKVTGVLYCSSGCAQAASSRRYRERMRAAEHQEGRESE